MSDDCANCNLHGNHTDECWADQVDTLTARIAALRRTLVVINADVRCSCIDAFVCGHCKAKKALREDDEAAS